MKKYFFFTLALCLCCVAHGTTATAKMLKVTSLSPRPLVMLYFADSSSESIGQNLLQAPMLKGQSLTLNLQDTVQLWDIMVFYAKNKKSYFGLERYDLGETVEVQITQEDFILIDAQGEPTMVESIKAR